MNAGTLTEQIEIFRKVAYKNDYGEKSYQFIKICNARASVDHLLGSRYVQNEEIWHGDTKTFKVRLHTDVDDEDRILYKNKWYIVKSFDINWGQQTITLLTDKLNVGIDNNINPDSDSNS